MLTDEEALKAEFWLRENNHPPAQILEYMRQTCKVRQDYILRNKPTTAEVFLKWPRLANTEVV